MSEGHKNPNNNTASSSNANANASSSADKRTEQHHDLEDQGVLPGVDEDLLKPLRVAEFIVDHPFGLCGCCLVFIVILAVLDSLLFELSEEHMRTWLVEDTNQVIHWDSWTLAEEARSDSEDGYTTPQTQQDPAWTIQLIFKLDSYDDKIDENDLSKTDYWIFTPENLEIIMEYEQLITEDPEWIDQFCYVINTTSFECDYDSVARDIAVHFDYDYDSMTTEEIKDYVWYLYTTSDSPGTIESMFNPEFSTTNQTFIYRSFLRSALPIATNTTYIYVKDSNGTETDMVERIIKRSKYRNDNNKYEDQEEDYDDWIDEYWTDITVKKEGDLKVGDLQIVLFENTIFNEEFNVLLLESMGWVGAAILAVLVWMTVHLQSLFLSFFAVIQINFSFPAAYFVYRFILQIDHFDVLSTLIIFVLLGVGADDVFVFTDAWRQSLHFVHDKNDLKQRMSFAYRRAAKAMLVTQTTTFCAFLATSASRIMPISAFGLWAASIVFCNYLLVITMYPALLLIHFKYVRNFERKFCCCCCPTDTSQKGREEKKRQKSIAAGEDPDKDKKKLNNNKKKEPNKPTVSRKTSKGGTKMTPKNKDEALELTTNSGMPRQRTAGDEDSEDSSDDGAPPVIVRRQSTVEELSVQYDCTERFFAIHWAGFINRTKWIIIIAFAALFAIAVWQATRLSAQNEEEEWFPDEHYMSKVLDLGDDFASSEESDLVYVITIWGVKGVNRDNNADRWDPDKYGKIKWDNDFDISSYEAQMYFYEKCEELRDNELVFQASSVECPLYYFKEWLDSNGEQFPYLYNNIPGTNDTLGEYDENVQFEMFAEKMYNFTLSPIATVVNQDELVFVESAQVRDDNKPYVRYIAIGTYGKARLDDDLDDSRDAEDDWNDWRKDTFTNNKVDCPDTLRKPIMTSFRWCWMVTNEEFIISAFQGIGIALPLAFIVLLISTQNWIISIYATLDIIGVMACELGVMNVAGWDLGVTESVAIVIIIGFSVDYVVHLANAYLESVGGIRSERTGFALLTMGISVVSGALTTFLGGFFLIFPDLVFFIKMGILIMTTIFFSLAWSMLFFIALLSAIGPEFETGNIPLCNKISDMIMNREKDDD